MLTPISRVRWPLAILCGGALLFLYFFGLTRAGLLGPDEPRYAAIGRAMAQSGDWITPRLWDHPWFEKPPLLYWATAAGFQIGLGRDLAPRLPVATASVAFLLYFFIVLRREFGERAAFFATAILATSAGWLAYSHVGVPDLPMSAAFGAAMLTAMRRPRTDTRSSIAAGVLLGLAILAKGLVPLVLFVPALWFLRREWRQVLLLLASALIVAAPWYLLVTLRNGEPFVQDFFWKQQITRFLTAESLHPQPLWFYVPVLLAGLFPWSPLLLLFFSGRPFQEKYAPFLLAWFAFGFVFFSASRGKLPGYLLPLLPPFAALMGIALDRIHERSASIMLLLAASAGLLSLVPTIQDLVPAALISGLSRTEIRFSPAWLPPALAVMLGCAWAERTGRRLLAFNLVVALVTLSVVRFVWLGYPLLDRTASARNRWFSNSESITCVPRDAASERYSLDYYAGRDLPDCN
ncbi:MAG TPA: glycosyltransferase family 39 protein [Bryobacteraceae bacterium]|nr:glycosyltransferase family 39 protein [Bryobacteraceae bacterium]